MKGTVIAHSVVIATVVVFGVSVWLDIYHGIPTLGGDPMYLTKVVMFLVMMNLALWIGSLSASIIIERERKSREYAQSRERKRDGGCYSRIELIRQLSDEVAKWDMLSRSSPINCASIEADKENARKEQLGKFWQRKSNHAKWESFARKVNAEAKGETND